MSGKRGKNDAADAAANCEAVIRPTMRFVSVKSIGPRSSLFVHRARQRYMEQRTRSFFSQTFSRSTLECFRGRRSVRVLFKRHRSLDDALLNGTGSVRTRRLAYEHKLGQKAAIEVHLLDIRDLRSKECCPHSVAGGLPTVTQPRTAKPAVIRSTVPG